MSECWLKLSLPIYLRPSPILENVFPKYIFRLLPIKLKQTSFIFIISFIIQNFHPFSPTYIKLGHSWRFSMVFQASSSSAKLSSSPWGNPTCSHVRRDMQSLQQVLGLPQDLHSDGRAWKTSKERHPRGILNRFPTQLS